MDITSVANLYTGMSSYSLQTAVSTAVLDKAMDSVSESADRLLEGFDMGALSDGIVGTNIDVYA